MSDGPCAVVSAVPLGREDIVDWVNKHLGPPAVTVETMADVLDLNDDAVALPE